MLGVLYRMSTFYTLFFMLSTLISYQYIIIIIIKQYLILPPKLPLTLNDYIIEDKLKGISEQTNLYSKLAYIHFSQLV